MGIVQRKGLTAIELLMTIALIAIISGIGAAHYINFSSDAKEATTLKAMTELKGIIRGNSELTVNGQFTMQGYLTDMGRYPASLEELTEIGEQTPYNPHNKKGWRGPYINESARDWTTDAWGTPLAYNAAGPSITSCGPDKVCGGVNASDDIALTIAAETAFDFDASSSSTSAPDPVDGVWSPWGDWVNLTDCGGAACGMGTQQQRRVRTCTPPRYGGADCVGLTNEIQTASCPLDPCPVDGVWGNWSDWADIGSCSVPCGAGTKSQERTRLCNNPAPAHGGNDCSPLPLSTNGDGIGYTTETQGGVACNLGVCPINGGWSATAQETIGDKIYDYQLCNNPEPAFGGTDCAETSGWTLAAPATSPQRQRRAASCVNGATLASDCATCGGSEVFLISGNCGTCSGTLNISGSIGSRGATTTRGNDTLCTLTVTGALTVLGHLELIATNVVINASIDARGGGGLGGNGGAGGKGGGSSGGAGSPAAGSAGSAAAGGGSAGSGGALGTACAASSTLCRANSSTLSDGANGTSGGNGSHASAAGQVGTGGGGGGGGGGGRAGRSRATNHCSSGSWGFNLEASGGGGGAAGSPGGGAITITARTISGTGGTLYAEDTSTLGGNGTASGNATATQGSNGGAGGTASATGSRTGAGSGAPQQATCSGTVYRGGDGGTGGAGGLGGDGSVSLNYTTLSTTLTPSVGSGCYVVNGAAQPGYCAGGP